MSLKIFVTDIEADNLYLGIKNFWCAFVQDAVTGEKVGFRPHQLKEYIEYLRTGDVVVTHNGIDFDFPALVKLSGVKLNIKGVFDTLVLSRMIEPDRIQGHSLKQWGKSLGILKGEYGEENETAWDAFTEEMYTYCEQDVEVTVALYKHLCEKAGFDFANPPCSKNMY